MLYLPRGTPYLPRGTLREVLAYPLKAERFDEDAFDHALSRLGLERLVPLLDVDAPLGPRTEPGRAAVPRVRAHRAADAALGAHR